MKKTTDRNCKLLEKETLKVVKELLLQLQKNIKSRERVGSVVAFR